MTALAERVLPLFEEFGVTGFVVIGYVEDGDGKLRRICIVQTRQNPIMEDALRPVIHFAHMWGCEAAGFRQPPQPGGDTPT